MQWTLTEIVDKECHEPEYFPSKEDAFLAMCSRVSELTGTPLNVIYEECKTQVIWTANINSSWAVVGRSFAWIKGDVQYDWDVREVQQ